MYDVTLCVGHVTSLCVGMGAESQASGGDTRAWNGNLTPELDVGVRWVGWALWALCDEWGGWAGRAEELNTS